MNMRTIWSNIQKWRRTRAPNQVPNGNDADQDRGRVPKEPSPTAAVIIPILPAHPIASCCGARGLPESIWAQGGLLKHQ